MKKQQGTIYAIVRKDQHVRLMADAMRHLQTAGHKVRLIQHVGNRGALNTLAQIRQERLPFTYARWALARARAGDTVVYAVKAGVDKNDGLKKLANRRVRLAMVCEGGRFRDRSKYHPTLPIPFLAWGPSASGIDIADVRVVGAPAMERLPQSKPRVPKMALINYKFTYAEKPLGADGAWGRAAIRAAQQAGYEVVVSCHPASTIPEGVEISRAPVTELLSEAQILISRASTIVYDALMMGVQPFYLDVKGDHPREFRRPAGSYSFCEDEAALLDAIQSWENGSIRYGSGFLDGHVSRDPNRSAALRMADEIAKIHLGPPLIE